MEDNEYWILALSGGGARGLFTASILEELEAATKGRLSRILLTYWLLDAAVEGLSDRQRLPAACSLAFGVAGCKNWVHAFVIRSRSGAFFFDRCMPYLNCDARI
jgi:hypothetical protein